MKIFIDFDDTILNTTKGFFTALRDVFVRNGVPAEMVDRTYEQCVAQQRASDLHYTPQVHADFLRAEGYALLGFERSYEQLLSHTSRWVYRDFAPFMQQCAMPVTILSHGDQVFQMAKISASGVVPLVEDVIIVQNAKAPAIARDMSDASEDGVVLVDNDAHIFPAVKALRRPTMTVHMTRGGVVCENRTCDAHCTSFADLCAILQKSNTT